jgi:hypothetical protein
MYDYFVAKLACPNCGTVSAADSSTNLQTHIRDDARGIEIPVGFELDPLEVRDQDIEESGYLPTGGARSDDRTRLLAPWVCPTCNHENWARVTLAGTNVSAIEAVALDRAALAGAQFIAESCFVISAQLLGRPLADFAPGGPDPVAVLRKLLP